MAETKDEIVAAIRREATANGGVPLSQVAFIKATGISRHNWRGRYWARWGDAIIDAGYTARTWGNQSPIGELSTEDALSILALVTREAGHFPTASELILRKRVDPNSPHPSVFKKRLGLVDEQVDALYQWTFDQPEWSDVAAILAPLIRSRPAAPINTTDTAVVQGYVYLFVSGAFHKVGRSNHVGRRSYEVSLQLPERLEVVHQIETDDPEGIESYWHRRFATKRANGEWFKLSPQDVAAFKRRKYQ